MSATTADSLGMSRAILVNDSLVKRLQQLDDMEQSYRHLVDHTERVLRAFYALTQCFKGTQQLTLIVLFLCKCFIYIVYIQSLVTLLLK